MFLRMVYSKIQFYAQTTVGLAYKPTQQNKSINKYIIVRSCKTQGRLTGKVIKLKINILSTCPILVDCRSTVLVLHHNQFLDVIVKKSKYGIKKLIDGETRTKKSGA